MRGRRGRRHQPVHVSQVAVQGDLVLVVAVAQFLDERIDLLARTAGQIDQPAMQVLVFTDRDPAQSPQRRLRHLMGSGATLERLRRMRDQPDIIDHGAVHRRERLYKLHDCDAAQSRRGHERIARHRLGRLCVEAPEVNDAGQARRPIADDFHQAPHVIGIAGAHAEARCIALLELCAMHDLDDGVLRVLAA